MDDVNCKCSIFALHENAYCQICSSTAMSGTSDSVGEISPQGGVLDNVIARVGSTFPVSVNSRHRPWQVLPVSRSS